MLFYSCGTYDSEIYKELHIDVKLLQTWKSAESHLNRRVVSSLSIRFCLQKVTYAVVSSYHLTFQVWEAVPDLLFDLYSSDSQIKTGVYEYTSEDDDGIRMKKVGEQTENKENPKNKQFHFKSGASESS